MNVPALIGLILGILGALTAFIPFCGACVAIPMAVIALILALVGFGTAKKHDSGTGLAMGATIVSILAIVISVGWWGWAYMEGKEQQEREEAERAKLFGLGEEMTMDLVKFKVTDVTEKVEGDRIILALRVTVTSENVFGEGSSATQENFVLVDKVSGAESKPIGQATASLKHETTTPLDLSFDVAGNHGELHLKITSAIDSANYRNVKVATAKAPAAGPGPGPGGG